MVVCARISNGKSVHRHPVKKPDLWEGWSFGGEIVTNEEDDFVLAGFHFIGRKQRVFRLRTVDVRPDGGEERCGLRHHATIIRFSSPAAGHPCAVSRT